jgi:hypothetical protein
LFREKASCFIVLSITEFGPAVIHIDIPGEICDIAESERIAV